MKTLIKLAKTNKSLPILRTVLIKDGIAKSTDMDMIITEPTNIKDGLYHADGIEAGLLSDQSVDNYPLWIAPVDHKGDIEIALDYLDFVSGAMSKEVLRYYLNGIALIGSDMVATDGHRLYKVDLKHGYDFKNVIIPSLAVKMAISLAKEYKAKVLKLSVYQDKVTFKIGSATLETRQVDGKFPDYIRVIPTTETHKFEYVPDLAAIKLAKIKAKVDGNRMATIVMKSPIRIGFNADYLADIMPGTMTMNDPASPVKVINGDRLQVLMPMRVQK
jgi:DNA polymerase III sliding clamp (beta) subunit (PCNA family)